MGKGGIRYWAVQGWFLGGGIKDGCQVTVGLLCVVCPVFL